MTDIIPHVAELLAPTGAQIELSWQDTLVTFPLIVISVPSNMASETSGGDEILTNITVQVDAYTLDKKNTVDLAKSIDAIMTPAGFRRGIAQHLTEGELERYMMQYSCTVDFTHQNILI